MGLPDIYGRKTVLLMDPDELAMFLVVLDPLAVTFNALSQLV
jgi:hypothetical protein